MSSSDLERPTAIGITTPGKRTALRNDNTGSSCGIFSIGSSLFSSSPKIEIISFSFPANSFLCIAFANSVMVTLILFYSIILSYLFIINRLLCNNCFLLLPNLLFKNHKVRNFYPHILVI